MNPTSVYIAWRSHDTDRAWSPIGRLDRHADNDFRFYYTNGSNRDGFRLFPGMTERTQVYKSKELFPMFSNRVLSSRRAEYRQYLDWSGFDGDTPPDPLAILQVTEGRRSTDYFEVFPNPSPDESGNYHFRFFLHGIERMDPSTQHRANQLETGERLLCMYDIQNQYDPLAVAMRTEDDRRIVCYLPRYLTRDLHSIVDGCDPEYVNIQVRKLNKDAPLQFRVLCDMTACWPDSYRPLDGPEFKTLATV